MTRVIKRNNKNSEDFQINKLHESIVKTCYSIHLPDGQSQSIADQTCKQVIDWVESQLEITTRDIREVTAKILVKFHPEVAYLYKQRNIII